MKTILFIVSALMIALVLMSGCSTESIDDGALPEDIQGNSQDGVQADALSCLMAPTVIGTVLEVKDDGSRILVDAKKELDDQVEGEIWITISDETYFFEDVDEQSTIGVMNVSRKFKVGNKVAFVTGDILESYPMQTVALSVYENVEQ